MRVNRLIRIGGRSPDGCSIAAPSRTTVKGSTTACSSRTMIISCSCSSTASGRATADRGNVCWATRSMHHHELLRAQLRWALTHGMRDRVLLLIDHGVDVRTPFDDGRTPTEVGRGEWPPRRSVADLEAAGAAPPELDGRRWSGGRRDGGRRDRCPTISSTPIRQWLERRNSCVTCADRRTPLRPTNRMRSACSSSWGST